MGFGKPKLISDPLIQQVDTVFYLPHEFFFSLLGET
jgi:hypothetical protein